jgi:spermidine synthase
VSATPLFAIESHFPEADCVLRFLEPDGSCANTLWQRLFAGTYDKPFILDVRKRRFLQFGLHGVQSAMHLQHPDRLSLAYTRMMMAFLLFNRSPARILLLGLGGGSLAKFCYRRLPATAITAVEVNPHVIALRNEFYIPEDDERFRVIHGDGVTYVADTGRHKDVILADACDHSGIAPELDALEFYQNAWRRLSDVGVFVLNLCGDRLSWPSHLLKLRLVFGEDTLTLPGRRDGNVIVLAFKQPRVELYWQVLEAAARDLRSRFGLDFPHYVQRIARDWKRRRRTAPLLQVF